MLHQKQFLEFRGYEIASETIFGTIRCYSEARRQFYMYEYLPFPPIASYIGRWALCGHLPSNGTQSSEGKSGPVETGLTGLAAMALVLYSYALGPHVRLRE